MSPNDVRSEISNLAGELLKSGLAVAVNGPVLHGDGPVIRITWPASLVSPGLFTSTAFASIAEYRRFLFGGHYICLMYDGGLLQISVDVKHMKVVGHRMCFYPCPIILPKDFEVTDSDELDNLLLKELQIQMDAIATSSDPAEVRLRLRSPLRFDFDPEHATEPPSHLHVSNPDARVPVHSSLSVGHFVQFVLRHFYPSAWDNGSLATLTRWPIKKQKKRAMRSVDEFELHFDCRYHAGRVERR
jgi:hypothetical protein